MTEIVAGEEFLYTVGRALGHAGKFDYQRDGSFFSGYVQYPQFRDISNFNVGLFCQQAGTTLEETLNLAGTFAKHFSINAKPGQPHGLDSDTAKFIEVGFRAGESGLYGQAVPRPKRR